MIRLNLGPTDFIFDIKKYPKSIGILFSGGIESTLLLYLLTQEMQNTDHEVESYVIDRPNNPIDKSKNIFAKISKGTLNVLEIPKVEYWQQVPMATAIVRVKHDVVLRGMNKYPSDQSIRPNYIFNFQETAQLRLPFKDLDKTQTIKAFYKLGIEDLLPFTHSCGRGFNTTCGECFNCLERAWAYNSLGLEIDLGC